MNDSRLQSNLKALRPLGGTFLLALAIFVFLVLMLEAVLRTDGAAPYLSRLVPDLGSRHHQLEIQLKRLDVYAAENGGVDCVFLGSSLVWLGVYPDVFEDGIAERLGVDLECFNLGIEALPAGAAGVLAEFVAEQYQPWLLLYGTSARDFAPTYASEEMQVVLETPWIQYRNGQKNLKSWLYTRSFVFRYVNAISQFLRFEEPFDEIGVSPEDRSGFLPKTRPAQEIHFQAAAAIAAEWLQPYTIQPENIEGLREILTLNSPALQIVIVEMPVQVSYFDYFQNGRADYDRFLRQIQSEVQSEAIVFIETSDRAIVPEEGWWDRSHMNMVGAQVFSDWLAQAVVEKSLNGQLMVPASFLEED